MTSLLDRVAENRLLNRWAALLERHPAQLNEVHEADAELIPFGAGDQVLALTVDTIVEEIRLGFFQQPETMGWMGATACLSDLAAVGATPLGVVVSVCLPQGADAAFQQGMAQGLDAACRAAGTFVLGGDTSYADAPSITGCALGSVSRKLALRRVGCREGDLVYATGPLGAGAAAAARAVLALPDELYAETDFRPRARLAEARVFAPFVTAAMDTSDGLVATLDQLARLNGVGFHIDAAAPEELLEPAAKRVCQSLGAPALAMLAAHHGEFELVFTVRPGDRECLDAAARAAGLCPLLLGCVTRTPTLRMGGVTLDGARIRDLADGAAADPRAYLGELLRLVTAAGSTRPPRPAGPARPLRRHGAQRCERTGRPG